MNLISDDRGAVFGIFLFLMICVFLVFTYAVTEPVMGGFNEAFDDDYRDTYMTAELQSSSDYIYNFLFKGSVISLFIIIFSAIMVINRAIRIGEVQ